MCPSDIEALGGVSEVTIQSDQGEMANVSVMPFDLPPGNCMCYYQGSECVDRNSGRSTQQNAWF